MNIQLFFQYSTKFFFFFIIYIHYYYWCIISYIFIIIGTCKFQLIIDTTKIRLKIFQRKILNDHFNIFWQPLLSAL